MNSLIESNDIHEIYATDELCPFCGNKMKMEKLCKIDVTLTLPCKCEEEKSNLERRNNIKKGEIIIRNRLREESGLLRKQINVTFDNFLPVEGQESAYQNALDFAINYKTRKGLLLCGTVGCGKTYITSAIVNRIIDGIVIDSQKAEQTGKNGYITDNINCFYSPVRFIGIADLLPKIGYGYNKKEDVIAEYKSIEVLILDDLGTEAVSSGSIETSFRIIDYRDRQSLPVVITTNLTPDELKRNYGERLYDRISSMCEMETLFIPSLREKAQKIS